MLIEFHNNKAAEYHYHNYLKEAKKIYYQASKQKFAKLWLKNIEGCPSRFH